MRTPNFDEEPGAERKRIIRSRNVVLALVLAAFVVLVFAISIAKMS
jgi:hypothetical protein